MDALLHVLSPRTRKKDEVLICGYLADQMGFFMFWLRKYI